MTSTEEKPAPIIFGDESLSDCTLVIDNQDFKIHKMVLASRSEVFKAMFYGDFKESKEDQIEIKDVSIETFRRLLEIIYTSRISDSGFLVFPKKDSSDHVILKLKEKDTDKNTKETHYIESFGKYFHDLWKNTTELINVADRFDLSSIVKYYLKTVMDEKFHCYIKNCHACFNYEAIGVLHCVGTCSTKCWYNRSVYSEWMKYAGEEPFPCSTSIKDMRKLQDMVDFPE